MQELKVEDRAFPESELQDAGYHAVCAGPTDMERGVAILAREKKPVETRRALPGDPSDKQARYIEAAVNGALIACIYLPKTGTRSRGQNSITSSHGSTGCIRHAATLYNTDAPVVLAGEFPMWCRPNLISIRRNHWTRTRLSRLRTPGTVSSAAEAGLDRRPPRTASEGADVYKLWHYLRNRWPRDAGVAD